MNVANALAEHSGIWRPATPANEQDIRQLVAAASLPLPEAYLALLRISDGRGELLALDLRQGPPHSVVTVPAIGMSLDDAVVVAPEFESFIRILGCEPTD